jgi:DNA-directed RNA polymerase subunit RPC12/RpoP
VSDKPVAYWSISLDTECPECKAEFDLIDLDSFRESSVNPLDRVEGYEATCPHCEHEYLLALEY